MEKLTDAQLQVITRYGWKDYDVFDPDVVVEVDHPNGSVDVYISRDGAIYVEEGDDLDGYELVPLADSFMACQFPN